MIENFHCYTLLVFLQNISLKKPLEKLNSDDENAKLLAKVKVERYLKKMKIIPLVIIKFLVNKLMV